MENEKGVSQAQRVSRHHKTVDVHMNSAAFEEGQESTVILHLQSEVGRFAQAGDWDGLSAVAGAIFVFSKGMDSNGSALRAAREPSD